MKNLSKYFNRKWTSNGHTLTTSVEIFEDEAGNQHQGIVGRMDGEVQQYTMDQFRADSETYHYIKHMLELHASGTWGMTQKEINQRSVA